MINNNQNNEKPKIGFETITFPERDAEKPDFLDTVTAVVKNNDFVNIAKIIPKAFQSNPLANYAEREEGFDYYDEKHYAGIPAAYWDKVSDAVATGNQKEVDLTRQNIQSELADLDTINRAGFTGGALSFASGVISPTYFLPVGAAAKYATFGKGFASGIKQILPSAISGSMISNTAEVINHETRGAQDWVNQTIVDSIFSTGIGSIVGAKRIYDARVIQKAQGALQSIHEDVKIDIKAGPNGEFKGYKASAISDSVGASRVEQVQSFLDNGIATVGENKFFQLAFHASPTVRGMTNPFNAVRQLTNRLFKPNLVTGAIEKGNIETLPCAHDIYMDYKSLSDAAQSSVKDLWTKYAGIDSGIFKGTRAWNEARKKGLLDQKSFREEVGVAMSNGDKHAIAEVQQAAELVRKRVYEPLFNHLVELGKLDKNIDVKTAISYLNRIWDKGLILEDPDGFRQMCYRHYSDVNNIVNSYVAPLKTYKSNIANLKEQARVKGIKPEVKKDLKERINQEKKLYDKKRAEIQTEIDNGKIPAKALNKVSDLDAEQLKKLESLHEPIILAEKDLKNAKKSKDKKKITEAKERLEQEKSSLKKRLVNEEIDSDLTFMDSKGNWRLRKLDEKTWFRDPLTESEWNEVAENTMNSILEMNDEQIAGRIFGEMTGKRGKPDSLNKRTWMIEDNNARPYLIKDVNQLMDIYAGQLGKYIGLEEMYLKYGSNAKEGKAKIISTLKDEYNEMRAKIEAKPESDKKRKELSNLKKEFDSSEQFMNDQLAIYMGNYVDPNSKIKRATNAFRSYNVATQMGALLLTSLTDLTMPIFRFGFWEYMQEGIIPTIKNFKKLMIDKKAQRGDLRDAALACETAIGGMLDERWGNGIHYQPKTAWERIPKNLASIQGNVNFSNQFGDLMQTIVGQMSMSKTIRELEGFSKTGKLTQKQLERFGLLGLDPTAWAKPILEQVKKHGEFVDGAWVPNVANWTDMKAAQAFRVALRREMKATISVQSPLDVPLAFRKPVLDCITQYMSWGFGATTNLVIPLLQRPDAEKLSGIFALMSLGAFIGPLRQLASGRDVDLSPESLFGGAIFDSGVLGHNGDILSKLNSVLRIPYLDAFRRDVHRMKTPIQILGGPLGGTMETAQRMVNMFINGEINQNDLQRSIKLLPYLDNVLLRRPIGAMIKNSSLPETAAEARSLKE